MSTKIYDAYRVSKSVDLLGLLRNFTEVTTKQVAEDEKYLKVIHEVIILKAYEHYVMYNILNELTDQSSDELNELTDKSSDEFKKQFSVGHELMENYFDKKTNFMFNFFMERIFNTTGDYDRSTVTNMLISHTVPDFKVSVGMDDDYYYLKFFANGVYSKILSTLVSEFEELEDFHYQNQSDPPEDIPYEEYQKRDTKWDEITGPVDNYTRMMLYDIFTATQLRELLEKYYYTGEDVFQHLAYKFDNFDIIKDPNRVVVSLDDYRSEGCKVFSGQERGEIVAKHILENYGENVNIEIPDDVYSISSTFQRGFNQILPDKLDWDAEIERRTLELNQTTR